MEWYEKKRGRPSGSKTRLMTPGKKRAKEFFDLQLDAGLKPTKAAKKVAEQHSTRNNAVEPSQIFKDAKRHHDSLVADEWAAALEAKKQFEELQSSMIGPQQPNDANVLVEWIAINVFRGHRLK